MTRKSKTTPGVGHNSTGAIDKDRLRALVERIESIEAERAELASDVRDVYAEAKGQGFDVAALRTIIKLRKQDQAGRDARQAVVDSYLEALGMLHGTPLGNYAIERAGLAPPV